MRGTCGGESEVSYYEAWYVGELELATMAQRDLQTRHLQRLTTTHVAR